MTKQKRKVKPAANAAAPTAAAAGIKLDIGCGTNKREGFIGIDRIKFPAVDAICDIRKTPWVCDRNLGGMHKHITSGGYVFAENSIAAAHCSHVLEHLTNFDDRWERVKFFNELYRIMAPGGELFLVLPHWCSNRYYGDPSHKEPFSEFGFYYLDRIWRQKEAPAVDSENNPDGYSCCWNCKGGTWGYTVNPAIAARNDEFKQNAVQWYKEAAMDITATLVATK